MTTYIQTDDHRAAQSNMPCAAQSRLYSGPAPMRQIIDAPQNAINRKFNTEGTPMETNSNTSTIQQKFAETTRAILTSTSDIGTLQRKITEQARELLASAHNGAGLAAYLNQWANDCFPADTYHNKKDASPLAKAGYQQYRTIQKTLNTVGAESDGTQYAFKFGTKKGQRDVVVTVSTASERAILDAVAKQQAKIESEAAEQLSTVRAVAEREEKSKLSDGDVAEKMAAYFMAEFGDTHNAADVSSVWAMIENQADDSQAVA